MMGWNGVEGNGSDMLLPQPIKTVRNYSDFLLKDSFLLLKMVGNLKLHLNAGTGLFNVFIVFGSSSWREGQEVKVGLSPNIRKCDLVELDFV